MAANIAETRKFEVKTPDVVVKVNPERTDLVETMEIEGKQYLVIQIDEHLEVNGISSIPKQERCSITNNIKDRKGQIQQ